MIGDWSAVAYPAAQRETVPGHGSLSEKPVLASIFPQVLLHVRASRPDPLRFFALVATHAHHLGFPGSGYPLSHRAADGWYRCGPGHDVSHWSELPEQYGR